jgi:two-component system response regulator GlrR
MADILLVDDDGELVLSLARVLSPLVAPCKIAAAGSAAMALEVLKKDAPKVAVVDLCLDEKVGVESGFALVTRLRADYPDMRVIVLTGHSSVAHGVKAMHLGAASFLEKPADPFHLAAIIKDAISHADLLRAYRELARGEAQRMPSELCGSSRAIQQLREEIEFAASSNQPVLLLGETGSGKSLCARLIHELSKRGSRRCVFYHPNFAGGDIVQSELFGHVKGAFTGATDSRNGLAQEADGGTLFIDELDAVPSGTQVLLLDLVQERRIRPVGADRFHAVDCRFIAATNQPIADALAQQRIRADLYHRLAHCIITIPSLRERVEDVGPLAERALARVSERESLRVIGFEDDVVDVLRGYTWPGNVRELLGVVEHAAYRAQFKGRARIAREDVQARLVSGTSPTSVSKEEGSFHEQVESFKRTLVRHALEVTGGNQAQAAERLGIDRGTIRRLSA